MYVNIRTESVLHELRRICYDDQQAKWVLELQIRMCALLLNEAIGKQGAAVCLISCIGARAKVLKLRSTL